MPTLPVAQSAAISSSPVRVRVARGAAVDPVDDGLRASFSFGAPRVGQPSEWPVPGYSACMTAKPRGSHVDS